MLTICNQSDCRSQAIVWLLAHEEAFGPWMALGSWIALADWSDRCSDGGPGDPSSWTRHLYRCNHGRSHSNDQKSSTFCAIDNW